MAAKPEQKVTEMVKDDREDPGDWLAGIFDAADEDVITSLEMSEMSHPGKKGRDGLHYFRDVFKDADGKSYKMTTIITHHNPSLSNSIPSPQSTGMASLTTKSSVARWRRLGSTMMGRCRSLWPGLL